MMWALYTLLLLLTSPLVIVIFVMKHGWTRATSDWKERLALVLGPTPPANHDIRLWFHAASLGELEAARVVLAGVRARHPDGFLYLTTLTPEAKRLAIQEKIADEVRLAPLDLPCLVRKILKKWNPQALVLVETELWPHLIRETARSGRVVMMVNGRLSASGTRRWRFFGPWVQTLLKLIRPLLVRTELDKQRFMVLGAEPQSVKVVGNLKFARAAMRKIPDRNELLNRLSLVPNQSPVLVAGSTWPGEEDVILEALIPLKKKWPQLLLVLAPRHPKRSGELLQKIRRQGLKTVLKSQRSLNQTAERLDCLLVDTTGELAELYALGDVALVGGSLVPQGGQNPIEPAACRLPVLFGPFMENFQVEAEALTASGAGFRVQPIALSQILNHLFANEKVRRRAGEAARRWVDSQVEVLGKTVHAIETVLHP